MAGATWVATEWVVVSVDEVALVFQGDGDRVFDVEEHCAFSLLPPGLTMHELWYNAQ